MKIIKIINMFTMLLFLAASTNIYAGNVYGAKPKVRVDEVGMKSIKLAADRTGIIKGVSCSDCDFRMVKITENTKATNKGKPVDILDLKSLPSDAVLGVAFDQRTREVLSINW